MPVPKAGKVGSLNGIPRGDRLVRWNRDATNAALIADGMAVMKSHLEAIEVEHVEIAGADLPADVLP